MDMTPDEARRALADADAARNLVADEAGAPAWYWWGLGAGWIVLGILVGFENWWLTTAATLALGTLHAIVGGRLMTGRYRSPQVRLSPAAAGRRTALVVWGFLLVMVAVTVALALALAADGAHHPAFFASLAPAAMVVLGGPHLMTWSAGRSARRAAA